MVVRVVQATPEDAEAITRLRVLGMANDPLWKASMGHASIDDQLKCIGAGVQARVGIRKELGTSQILKAVDEEGNLLGFTGVEIPKSLNDEEKARIKAETKGHPLPGENKALAEFFEIYFEPLLRKHGYDPTKHFKRLGLMVSADHQRKGLGRILTVKANEIADEKGAATYVEAGPKAAALFRAEGFEELERLDINLEKFGAEGGTASMYIMKRDPPKRTQ